MSKHTPGPWHTEPLQWDRGGSIAICSGGENGYIICTIAPENEQDEPTEDTAIRLPCDEANARLIAAAPDLLAALKHARAQARNKNFDAVELLDSIDRLTTDAIKKANP